MTLKLYGVARTRASRTLWMVHELGIDFEHVPVAIGEDGTRSAAFRRINPNGQIPVIDDDGVIVWESLAINLYLAKRHGGPLAPRDLAEDGHMTMWTVWAATELEPHAHEVMTHTISRPPEQRDPARRDAALARLEQPLDVLAGALEQGGGHLVGNRFTVADLNVACIVFYLRGAPEALDRRPALAAWYGAVTDRPAFREMLRLRGDA